MIDKEDFRIKKTSKILNDVNENEIIQKRLKYADTILNIKDEDGQPLYSLDWVEQNILKKNPD